MYRKNSIEAMLGCAIIFFILCASVLVLSLSYYCYRSIDQTYQDTYELRVVMTNEDG